MYIMHGELKRHFVNLETQAKQQLEITEIIRHEVELAVAAATCTAHHTPSDVLMTLIARTPVGEDIPLQHIQALSFLGVPANTIVNYGPVR